MNNLAVLAFTAIQNELKKDITFMNYFDTPEKILKDILISDEEICVVNYSRKDNRITFLNKNTKEGVSRMFFEDPELQWCEKYIYQHKNDLRNGFFREYYENGMLKVETEEYVNGKLEGMVKEYYPNGNLRFIFQFKNNRMNGIQQIFSEEYTNLLIAEEIYEEENIKVILEYDIIIENNILKSYLSRKVNFLNGKVHGECIEYFPNRSIKEITIYFLGNK